MRDKTLGDSVYTSAHISFQNHVYNSVTAHVYGRINDAIYWSVYWSILNKIS
jgi:hypothetical protein